MLRSAEIEAKQGNPRGAMVAAEQILSADPSHLGALELRAKCEWQTGAYEAVLRTLDRLMTINPYEGGYHALRGASLQCLGRYGEAYRAFERTENLPGREEIMAELHEWQAAIVTEMLREDRVFRAHYRQDPAAACAARGFHIARKPTPTGFLPRPTERANLFTRPS